MCLLLTLIFPWTKLVISSSESNTDKVFITFCSNQSQCSVISSLLDPDWKRMLVLLKIRIDFNYFTENNNQGNTYQIPDSKSNLDTHYPTLGYTKNIFSVHWKCALLCFYLQALYAVIFLAYISRSISALSTLWGSAMKPDLDWQLSSTSSTWMAKHH